MKTFKNLSFNVDLVLYLVHKVIFNDPTTNCHIKGRREDWTGLPKSKSLFFSGHGKGFPIGNLTSQLFGNIYLDDLDHFVREELKVRHYGRYVDDMVFVHQDKEFLKEVVLKIRDYLNIELGLTLHPKKIYLQNFKQGVYFLGVFIKPNSIYIGKKTKQGFYVKIETWNKLIVEDGGLIEMNKIAKFLSSMNSYLGIMKHYKTYFLRKKIIIKKLSNWWWNYVYLSDEVSKFSLKQKKL